MDKAEAAALEVAHGERLQILRAQKSFSVTGLLAILCAFGAFAAWANEQHISNAAAIADARADVQALTVISKELASTTQSNDKLVRTLSTQSAVNTSILNDIRVIVDKLDRRTKVLEDCTVNLRDCFGEDNQ